MPWSLLVNGQPALLGAWHFANTNTGIGHAPSVNNKKNKDAINAAMRALNIMSYVTEDYQLEEVDLSGFTPLP